MTRRQNGLYLKVGVALLVVVAVYFTIGSTGILVYLPAALIVSLNIAVFLISLVGMFTCFVLGFGPRFRGMIERDTVHWRALWFCPEIED